ncbi:Predicted periplasmic/secreted protein [Legionella beliardensis]|uniref:Predicted periplasmic/secreted protein n=1 Tax=Legionella beliardensis TaxID=91822 RepID=A0A378I2T6_9GAMM|nr:hypothetical protein [Legionella beliardensis]STX29252.1 Predicted periplasmic/secreted protein [Legionella beliardensis]
MKKITNVVALFLLPPLTFANNICPPSSPDIPLDKVFFQVSAKQWVSTQTALLTVDINATLNTADLVKARNDIMTNLNKIASGEWHLTQFDRSQDSSGLEKLFVEGQARIPQASLTDIYKNAKTISQPGSTYTINNIEFKPSLEEIQQVKSQIRQRLYQQVNEEISRLNSVYPNQSYSLSNLYINEGDVVIQQPRAYKEQTAMSTMAVGAAPGANLAVSNEITLSASAEVASNRRMDVAPCK